MVINDRLIRRALLESIDEFLLVEAENNANNNQQQQGNGNQQRQQRNSSQQQQQSQAQKKDPYRAQSYNGGRIGRMLANKARSSEEGLCKQLLPLLNRINGFLKEMGMRNFLYESFILEKKLPKKARRIEARHRHGKKTEASLTPDNVKTIANTMQVKQQQTGNPQQAQMLGKSLESLKKTSAENGVKLQSKEERAAEKNQNSANVSSSDGGNYNYSYNFQDSPHNTSYTADLGQNTQSQGNGEDNQAQPDTQQQQNNNNAQNNAKTQNNEKQRTTRHREEELSLDDALEELEEKKRREATGNQSGDQENNNNNPNQDNGNENQYNNQNNDNDNNNYGNGGGGSSSGTNNQNSQYNNDNGNIRQQKILLNGAEYGLRNVARILSSYIQKNSSLRVDEAAGGSQIGTTLGQDFKEYWQKNMRKGADLVDNYHQWQEAKWNRKEELKAVMRSIMEFERAFAALESRKPLMHGADVFVQQVRNAGILDVLAQIKSIINNRLGISNSNSAYPGQQP